MTDAPTPAPYTYPSPGPANTGPANTGPANPGRTMGIIALVLSIIGMHLVGIIVGLVALSQSKRVGQKNGFAVAGIIVGAVLMVLSIMVIALLVSGGFAFWGWLTEACRDLGPGVWLVDGMTYSCP